MARRGTIGRSRRRRKEIFSSRGEFAPNNHQAKSLTASARRLTADQIEKKNEKPESWVSEAYEMVNAVPELRYAANQFANRASQARLYIGKRLDDNTVDEHFDDENLEIVQSILRSVSSDAGEIVHKLAMNLFAYDGGWIIGVPQEWIDDEVKTVALSDLDDISDISWNALSTHEVRRGLSTYDITIDGIEFKDVDPDDVIIVRVWRKDPYDSSQSDSPVKSSMIVLRELVKLSQYLSSQLESRLLGAGILPLPASMLVKNGKTSTEVQDSFLTAASIAISDQSSAAARVPMVIGVPDSALGKIQHVSFASTLDEHAQSLREESIRRLALGLDIPAEFLLSMSSANHWGAWLADEQMVTTHIKPYLDIIRDALTKAIIRPILESSGFDKKLAKSYAFDFDVSDLLKPFNDSGTTIALYDRGVITSSVLVRSMGFDPQTDMPEGAPEMASNINPKTEDETPNIVDQTPRTMPEYEYKD